MHVRYDCLTYQTHKQVYTKSPLAEFDPRRLKAKGQKRTATAGLLAPGSCKAGLDIIETNELQDRREIKAPSWIQLRKTEDRGTLRKILTQ